LNFVRNPKIRDYFRSPKGRFFCLILLTVLSWEVITILPFNKGNNTIFAKSYNNFINIQAGTQVVSSLIIGGNNIVNAVPSPIFISSQNLGTLLVDDTAEQGINNSIIKYIVQKGETVSGIADKFNISVETILLANELSNSKIVPGQELMILPTNGIIHMVEKGETVKLLASKYKVEEGKIIDFNNLSDEGSIYVGDVLIIPGGKMPVKQASIPTIKDVSDTDTSASAQLALPGSYFMIPTSGVISQGAHFSYTSNGRSYYTSVDIANDIGTPILAAAGGEVQIVKNAWPYGNYLTIAHPNGVVTLYAHMSFFAKGIVSGMSVTQGQIIGYMGNTGKVKTVTGTGSHLHFEVRGATNPLTKYKTGTKVGN